MSKLFWATVAFLVTVTSAGAIFYEPRMTPDIADKRVLVELALNDHVKSLLHTNNTTPRSGLTVLSTPNLRNVGVPKNVQGISIKLLTQEEIDELSRVKPLNYIVFERVEKSHAYAGEVEVTFIWGYFDGMELPFGASGRTYICSNQSGEWVVSGGWGWIS